MSPIHHTERISPDNIHYLLSLFKTVFGKAVTLEYLKGKYDTTYLGKSYYGYIAFDEKNVPIAFHGCVPFRIKYKDSVEIGAQFGDAMTLKEYNGKGIFTILGKMVEELLEKEGINFGYGLPNQNSEYGYIHKLKWQHTERMTGFKIKTNAFPYETILRKLGLRNAYQKIVRKKLNAIICEERLIPHSMFNDSHATVLRDKLFFFYKSFTPNYIVKINGVRVWLKADGLMQVGDIDTREENKLVETIYGIKKLAKKLGLSQIVFQYHPNSEQEIILKKHFKTFNSWAIVYKGFNTKIPLEKLTFNYGDLDTF